MEPETVFTHASLFSGIGGFDLAARWMGWQNVFHCEIDPFCQQGLKHHFPESTPHNDINLTDFTPYANRIDILTAGLPCQPFSMAGNRKGEADDRYLWPETLRAIREIQPTWIIGENVAGIISMAFPARDIGVGGTDHTVWEQEMVLSRIWKDLEGEGYQVQPFVIPAAAVGAPHRRDRVWIVARRDTAAHADGGLCQRPEQPVCTRRDAAFVCGETTAHPDGQHWRAGVCGQDGPETGDGGSGLAANAQCVGQPGQGRPKQSRNPEEIATWETDRADDARGWLSEPAICQGDDGLSGRLAGITFSRWRNESLKALGNAVCPQVVLRIFKAIQQTERQWQS